MDTTSELLTNALFLLARHPRYWGQLRAEFADKSEDALSAENLLGSKLVETIIYESRTPSPYTRQDLSPTILLALRLHPVFHIIGYVALWDTTLPVGGGRYHDRPMFIPKGSVVAMQYCALRGNPEVFGDNGEAFGPERWKFLGFGGGNRTCLGQQKAPVKAAYVLVRVSPETVILTSRDSRDWKGELKITCKSANGCKAVQMV